eukprot:sb/3471940/
MGAENSEFNNGGCDASVEIAIVTRKNGRLFSVSVTVSHVPDEVHSVSCNISMISENGGRQIVFYARRACQQDQIWSSERCEDCPFLHTQDPRDTGSCTINTAHVVVGSLIGSVTVTVILLAGAIFIRFRCSRNNSNTVNDAPPPLLDNTATNAENDPAFPDGRGRQQAQFETPII